MGVILKAKDVSFADNAVGFIPAVGLGLEYLNFFGVNAAVTARNLAPGKPSGVIVGAPTYDTAYARLGQTAYVITQAPNTPDQTLVAVFRNPTEVAAQIIGNNPSPRKAPLTGNTFGASLWNIVGTTGDGLVNISFNQNQFDGTSAHAGATTLVGSLNSQAINTWRCIAGVHDEAANQATIRNLATGASNTGTASAPNNQADVGSSPFRIGYGNSSSLGAGPSDIAFAAIYSRALSAGELAAVYAQAKAFLATRGLAV